MYETTASRSASTDAAVALPSQRADAPDLAVYHAVHTAVRAAPHHLAAAAADIASTCSRSRHGLAEDVVRRIDAFRRYWHGVASEIAMHHRVEDEIVFPELRARRPDIDVFDQLDDDHHRLDEVLASCSAAADILDRPEGAERARAEFRALATLMDRHLDIEDSEILPAIRLAFDADEYRELEARANRAVGIGKQAAFTVPFVLWYADVEDRDQLLAAAPAAFRFIHRMTRRRHARLATTALGVEGPGAAQVRAIQ